jgi:signal peptidase II
VTRPATFPIAPVVIALCVLVLDVVTKRAVMGIVGPGAARSERWFVGNWLGMSYGENSGIAFGMFRQASGFLLTLLAIAGTVAIGWFIWAHRSNAAVLVAGGLVAGGAIGNILDRIRFGHVRDFIAVGPWPPFNVADSAITIGALVAAWGLWRAGKRDQPPMATTRGVTQAVVDANR